MIKLFLFSLLLILFSCSSSSKKQSIDDPLDQFNEISNNDFKEVETIEYDTYDDHYDTNSGDSLSKETLSRKEYEDLASFDSNENPLLRAMGLCYRKKFDAARNIFNKIYRRYKKHPGYWTQIGNCYLIEGSRRKALLFYNKAIDVKENYAPPVNNIGVIYLQQQFDQKALKAFSNASELNPYSLTPIFNMAQLYLEYGLIDEALEYFKVLRGKGKNDTDVLNGLAASYLFKGDIDRSLDIYSRIQDRHLRRPDISLNYAVALKLKGNTSQARKVLSNLDSRNLGPYDEYYQRVKKLLGGI